MRALMLASVASMIDQFNRNNIALLEEMGYEVDVACNFQVGNTSSDTQVSRFKNELVENGNKVIDIPIPRQPLAVKDIVKSYKMVKKLVKQREYDLVHCHSPIGGAIARLACKDQRKKGLKVIYTAHGFHFFTGAPKKNWIIFYPIEKYLGRYTDCLITICEEDYTRAKKKKIGKEVVYSPGVGICVSDIKNMKKDQTYRDEIGLSHEDILVLSVGELSKRKNHEVVLRAIAGLNRKDIHYVICGKGILEDKLRLTAKELGIEKQLHLLGFRTDAKEWLQTADIFAFPSYQEGLPVALMEAMAAGLPVVCSRIRGNEDLVVDGQGGYLCNPSSVEEFSKYIEQLVKQPQLQKKMGEYNQKRVEQFDIANVETIMRDIYTM